MAAEMENAGSQELAQFWKEVPKPKVMEHRSVKYLQILGDGLLPACSGVTSPLLDSVSPSGYAAMFWKVPDPQ